MELSFAVFVICFSHFSSHIKFISHHCRNLSVLINHILFPPLVSGFPTLRLLDLSACCIDSWHQVLALGGMINLGELILDSNPIPSVLPRPTPVLSFENDTDSSSGSGGSSGSSGSSGVFAKMRDSLIHLAVVLENLEVLKHLLEEQRKENCY